MGRAVQARATNRHGDALTVQSQETDSPILPVAQLQQLHEFRPDLVDLVARQTEEEAKFRRRETSKVNWFVFLERLIGQFAAIFVAAMGIGGGGYVGLHGQPWLGGVIASATIGTLGVAFLTRSAKQNQNAKDK